MVTESNVPECGGVCPIMLIDCIRDVTPKDDIWSIGWVIHTAISDHAELLIIRVDQMTKFRLTQPKI
jgi:hypothetical protein